MLSAEKISISLPGDMVQALKAKVSSGAYGSTSEVVRAALRLLQQQEEEHAARLDAIRARIHNSLNDARPDVGIDEAFERIEKFHALQA